MPEASVVYIVSPNTSPKRVTLRREAIVNKKNTKTSFPDLGKELLLVSDLQSGNFSISNFILKPVFIKPLNNSINYLGDVEIRPYTPSPTFKGTFSKVIIELATDKTFTSIISRVESTTDISLASLKPTTSKSKNYLRAKHISGEHMSDWSDIITVTVAQLEYIEKPTILTPINNSKDAFIKHLYIKVSPFTVIGASDSAQEYTEYQIALDTQFTKIVSTDYVRLNMNDIIVSNITFEYGTDYYIRVRHKGTKYNISEWSNTVKITTQANNIDMGEDGNNTRISGNDLDGAYYGEIDISRLTAPNYRGAWKEVLSYTFDSIVFFNGGLYKAKISNKNVPPTDSSTWEPYNGKGLPTAKWLLDSIGIGYGLQDNNIDGLSNGQASIGNIVNSNTGWLKFVYKERVFYTTTKPIINNISWNDLAKRYVANKKRTIRINNRLYYIRLMTDEEYNNTLVPLTSGKLGNFSLSYLELNKPIWVDDDFNGAAKKTLKDYGTLLNVDCMSRSASYRPVLELISAGEEPYNNLPTNIPLAESELFKYDANTDTGYFGLVKSSNIVTGDNLAGAIGLGIGVSQNSNTNWLKFYYHGMIIYTPQKPLRHTILKGDLLDLNAVYGIDLGLKRTAKYIINGTEFGVGILSGAGKAPSEMIEISGDPKSTEYFAVNVKKEIGRGSMWNDLIYRIHAIYVDDVLENQDTLNYKELHGGVQIGNNFDNFSSSDLGIIDGDGSNALCQEVSSVNPLETISRGYYFLPGVVRQGFNQRLSIFGWRPILIK